MVHKILLKSHCLHAVIILQIPCKNYFVTNFTIVLKIILLKSIFLADQKHIRFFSFFLPIKGHNAELLVLSKIFL